MLELVDIKKLFAILQARFGHKWTTAYDDPQIMAIAVQEWHRELQGFRPEDIRRALTAWDDPWPPTLPAFSRACLPDLAELGFNLEREISRQTRGYYYEPDSDYEIRKRIEAEEEVRERVTRKMTTDALELVREEGVQTLLEHTANPLRIAGHD